MSKGSSYVSLGRAFREGSSSPAAFLRDCLGKMDALEPRVKAFVNADREAAIEQAEQASRRWRDGKPLSHIDGMPVGIKDIIETAHLPTGQGSPLWTDFETRRDSASVQALMEAGAIILGKTATTEFASTEQYSPTTNPHDVTRTPGGSSSGSAAAVGAGMVPVALGSQVVGSTTRPASFCGCIGYKPSVGALNRGGSYDYLSQSCVGLFGAALEDVWATGIAIASRVGGDPGYPGLRGPAELPPARKPTKIAVLETVGWKVASSGARAAFEAQLERVTGHCVAVIRRTDDPALNKFEQVIEKALDLTWEIMSWEFRWPLGTYVRQNPNAVSEAMRGRLADAEAMSLDDYRGALQRREEIRARFAELSAHYDGFLALAATGAAPSGLNWTGDPSMNVPASLLGAPAISVPLMRDEGLPLGLQVIGGNDRDADVMSLAGWLESV